MSYTNYKADGEGKGIVAQGTDKFGDVYDIRVRFEVQGIPQEYIEAGNKYIDYDVLITSVKDPDNKRHFTLNQPSSTLMFKFPQLAEELELQRKMDKLGEIAHGINVAEIHIDFEKHYEDMIVAMVNDFVEQFDEKTVEEKMQIIQQALVDNADKSIMNLVGTIFENTAEIKNFLALDNTGELKKKMESVLNDSIQKGKIDVNIFKGTNLEHEAEYEMDER